MKDVRVKFCGITSIEDGLNAVTVGADALGFVFYKKSPRYVTLEQAEKIIKSIPPFVSSVGIFVNEDLESISEAIERCGLNTVQLHGDEDVKYCSNFKNLRFKDVKLIKAIRVSNKESLHAIEDCPADAILLDTFKKDAYGGTGKAFDRALAVLAKEYGRHLIMSGGLNPENVYDVIKETAPYAVDVSSGIESSPGKKNLELMEMFIREVRRTREE
ncbi:MAG: phosphoribosylanthranilate isomerase [Candidatus Omnitrophota bacterium]